MQRSFQNRIHFTFWPLKVTCIQSLLYLLRTNVGKANSPNVIFKLFLKNICNTQRQQIKQLCFFFKVFQRFINVPQTWFVRIVSNFFQSMKTFCTAAASCINCTFPVEKILKVEKPLPLALSLESRCPLPKTEKEENGKLSVVLVSPVTLFVVCGFPDFWETAGRVFPGSCP